jgi:DNA-binding transcriptional MocR family regulator
MSTRCRGAMRHRQSTAHVRANLNHYHTLHIVLTHSILANNAHPESSEDTKLQPYVAANGNVFSTVTLVHCLLIPAIMSGGINLQLGWPLTSLFPANQLLDGASSVLNSQKKTAELLTYEPDVGYEPLRQSIVTWLSSIYGRGSELQLERTCATDGASRNPDNVLARLTEPGYTRTIWMVEPCYFLACPVFIDNGYEGIARRQIRTRHLIFTSCP